MPLDTWAFGPEEAMYVLLRVDSGYSTSDVQQDLRQRLPEVDVLTRNEFARKSRTYWTIKTGAGRRDFNRGAIGVSDRAGGCIPNHLCDTMENIEEYATLKALGASQAFVARHCAYAGLICGAAGSILGLLALFQALVT